jgi:hypothetical protein
MEGRLTDSELESLLYYACSSGTGTPTWVRDKLTAACIELLERRHIEKESIPMSNTEPCGINGCDAEVCITCKAHDCKWPGACKGRCAECGGPNPNANGHGGDPKLPPSCNCSDACNKASWDRGIANGTIVSLSDLTPEQVNEEFGKIGLGLEGVGKRNPS